VKPQGWEQSHLSVVSIGYIIRRNGFNASSPRQTKASNLERTSKIESALYREIGSTLLLLLNKLEEIGPLFSLYEMERIALESEGIKKYR
jgi:hypothetical protein